MTNRFQPVSRRQTGYSLVDNKERVSLAKEVKGVERQQLNLWRLDG